MSRKLAVSAAVVVLLGLLSGCQDQQSEPIAPQLAKAKPNRTLTVTGGGTGFGAVTAPEYGESGTFHCAIGAGTSDPMECSRVFPFKTIVVLTATADPGSAFAGWSGACTGTSTTCRVTMTQSRSVRASFSGSGVQSYTLNVSGSGTGNGTVRSQTGLTPAINCTITAGTAGATGCSASYTQGTAVTLTATAATNHTFTGWSGNCTGTGTCAITMSSNRAVTGGFTAPPPPEATSGRWDASASTNIVGLHLVQLFNGKGLMWGHMGEPYLWNGPGAGEVQVPNNTCINPTTCELFCAGHAFLADGSLLVAGGHNEELGDLHGINQASIFDGTTWTRTGYMTDPRWYPTLVTLANGDVLAISGSKSPGILSTIPERYSNGTWTRLTGIDKLIPAYPRAFVEPKAGNVFIADGDVHELNPNGTGSWSAGVGPADPDRSYGPAVMLDSKVLFIGGGGKEPCPTNLPRKTTTIIDLAAAAPAWGPSGSMQFARRQANATILPDGSVLVTGGTSLCGFSNESGAVFAAELWNPSTGQFSQLANAGVVRVYHSTTMLLADGRVMSTGGGDGANVVPQRSYEIFSPPYLFKGARPTYTLGGGSNIHYGQSFVVSTPNAASIRKVTIIRLASSTHAFDMGQRLNTLTFTIGTGGTSLTVTPPAEGKIAPPGPYRLFLINDLGVPSVGQTILLNQ
jgi:hypothetical protein